MAKKKQAAEPVLAVPVNWGGVSIGDKTASIGMKIDRSILRLNKADEMLCGRQISARIEACDAHPDQGHFEFSDGVLAAMEGVFDLKSLTVSPKEYSVRLACTIASVDVSSFAKFAKRGGKLLVREVLGEAEGGEDAEEEGDEE